MANSLKIKKNIPLADKNWFKTGGSAHFYIPVQTKEAFQEAIAYANNNNLDLFILGKGANILISDEGFDGLVIHPYICNIHHEDYDKDYAYVYAGAGVSVENLISYCLDNNLIGLEEFSGIPGTIGGSIYINIHYFNYFISDFLVHGTIIDRKNAHLKLVPKRWFHFGYDTSTLLDKKHFLVQACFKVKKGTDIEAAYARGRKREIIRHRNARYPTHNTCGSFFRNFHPNETPYTIAGSDKKMIYIAYYLDKLGIKGTLCKEDVVVSHKHANMIINKGNATSSDIINVARTMQQMVIDTFAIIPQPECQLVGFKRYPLLR